MTCNPLAISDVGNVIVCTSATRPTGAQRYAGRTIMEMDTGRMYVFSGSAWVQIAGSAPRWNFSPSGGQNVATATPTALAWGLEGTDTDNFHSTVTNTERATIPAGLDGLYMVGYSFGINAGANTVSGWFEVNGIGLGVRYALHQVPNNASFGVVMHGSAPVFLTAGEFVNVGVAQNSGGTLQVNAALTSYQFWGFRICGL